jgi:iron complex outermembrane receptor protein
MWKCKPAGARPLRSVMACAFAVTACSLARVATGEEAPVAKHEPSKYEIIVSATRSAQDPVNVPNGATVVSGAELRRRGARTVADAIQDVVGVDTGDGSDNGARLPNIGMWGLKEFDALLITLDGVPVGGPFNPSLSQIPVEDVERIEIVKGPQGSLYGVSAFAGMVQVFTRQEETGHEHLTLGGGSFSTMHAQGEASRVLPRGFTLRASGMLQRADGWQDRTEGSVDRGALTLARDFGSTHASFDFVAYRDHQDWGTALPVDAGAPVPGFDLDRNYAVGGAFLEHRVFSEVVHLARPLGSGRIEHTLSYTRDNQISLRSFPGVDASTVDDYPSEGVLLAPYETTIFGDVRWLATPRLAGDHQLVAGGAVTWGRTVASGIGFDFDQKLSTYSATPGLATIPIGDHRSFGDRRTFAGVYVHDAWTPQPRVTLAGGGRYDNADEKLSAFGQEVGSPPEYTNDSKTTGAWSGDISLLARIAPPQAESDAVNLYANWKSSFKPAAPNLTEAENAKILEPERTHSVEGGLKLRGLDRQVAVNLSWFQMDFENMVVSTLDAGGNPIFINAGRERFKGQEVDLTLAPSMVQGLTLSGGYAYHDARFVEFTFVTPGGALRNVSGKRLELAPKGLFNARVAYEAPMRVGVWAASRSMGARAFNRRNTFFDTPFTQWDAGVHGDFAKASVSITGRNLSDDRHAIGESDIGDSQFYVSPPRRVSAEVSYRY